MQGLHFSTWLSRYCPRIVCFHRIYIYIYNSGITSCSFSKPEDWNGITLFFYHGAGGLHSHFRHQLEYFKDLRYRTVTYDMYGHGCSSSRQRYDYTFDQLCYDALALFDRYALTEENILVGHSYGTRYYNYHEYKLSCKWHKDLPVI